MHLSRTSNPVLCSPLGIERTVVYQAMSMRSRCAVWRCEETQVQPPTFTILSTRPPSLSHSSITSYQSMNTPLISFSSRLTFSLGSPLAIHWPNSLWLVLRLSWASTTSSMLLRRETTSWSTTEFAVTMDRDRERMGGNSPFLCLRTHRGALPREIRFPRAGSSSSHLLWTSMTPGTTRDDIRTSISYTLKSVWLPTFR